MSDTDIIFGLKPVQEALAQGKSINRIYVAKESRAAGCKGVIDEAKARSIAFDFVPQAKINELTGTRDHQGIAAKVSPIEYIELPEFLKSCPVETTVLVLDQIHHPKNLGMMIRTAVGAGVGVIVLTLRKGALIDDTVVRASTGTVYSIPIIVATNLGNSLKSLKDAGFWVYGMDAGGTCELFDVDWPKRVALVMGNETKGMRSGITKQCDEIVSIPLANNLDSLNVSIAAGVALFQIAAARK
jgi:23S rRNA (guanosine2251-2'-O)-methyltransferase